MDIKKCFHSVSFLAFFAITHMLGNWQNLEEGKEIGISFQFVQLEDRVTKLKMVRRSCLNLLGEGKTIVDGRAKATNESVNSCATNNRIVK